MDSRVEKALVERVVPQRRQTLGRQSQRGQRKVAVHSRGRELWMESFSFLAERIQIQLL